MSPLPTALHSSGSQGPERGLAVPKFLFVIRNAKQSVVNFALKSVRMPLNNEGERGLSPNDCPNCGGTGYVAKPVDLNGKSEGVAFIRLKCPACAGTGRKHPIPPTAAG